MNAFATSPHSSSPSPQHHFSSLALHTPIRDSITKRSFAILATIYAATVGTTSALVEAGDRTTVDVEANGYDTRTSGNGCSPSGCIPENTRDGSRSSSSRWSCKGDILDSSDEDDGCCITYYFEEPQDIVKMRIAVWTGSSASTVTLDVYDNGNYNNNGPITLTSSTSWYQTTYLYTDETEEIKLCLADPQSNPTVWLSLTEVQFWIN